MAFSWQVNHRTEHLIIDTSRISSKSQCSFEVGKTSKYYFQYNLMKDSKNFFTKVASDKPNQTMQRMNMANLENKKSRQTKNPIY